MAREVAPFSEPKMQSVLDRLRPEFAVLADYLAEVIDEDAWEDLSTGALLGIPKPDVGPNAYKIVLFPPLAALEIDQLPERTGRPIPITLRHAFRHLNGGFFGELSIYGSKPEIDRSTRAPLDIAMGEIWRTNYSPCDEELMLFASRNTSGSGQIRYSVGRDGTVIGRGNEQLEAPAEAGMWDSLNSWIAHQIALGF